MKGCCDSFVLSLGCDIFYLAISKAFFTCFSVEIELLRRLWFDEHHYRLLMARVVRVGLKMSRLFVVESFVNPNLLRVRVSGGFLERRGTHKEIRVITT